MASKEYLLMTIGLFAMVILISSEVAAARNLVKTSSTSRAPGEIVEELKNDVVYVKHDNNTSLEGDDGHSPNYTISTFDFGYGGGGVPGGDIPGGGGTPGGDTPGTPSGGIIGIPGRGLPPSIAGGGIPCDWWWWWFPGCGWMPGSGWWKPGGGGIPDGGAGHGGGGGGYLGAHV